MKLRTLAVLTLLLSGCSANSSLRAYDNSLEQFDGIEVNEQHQSVIAKANWHHGAVDCDNNQSAAHEVYQHDQQTFIIRQNKCLTFEAPFIYVFVGSEKILLLDTGALTDEPKHSLYQTLQQTLGREQLTRKELLVLHSHSHSDHYQGDAGFEGVENIKLVPTTASDVNRFLGFDNWPQGQKVIDLGDRAITVLATPGHQEEAITLYDHKNQWLMTGDTLYPGLIYVKDWQMYRNSIERLTTFALNNQVTAILGAHIEMKKQPSLYYPIGSTYQPDEASLDLKVQSLHQLNAQLQQHQQPTEIIFDRFIIKPMNGFQRLLSNIARWITQ
ncbi:MBL fold metallo-hydrolase [Psychrobium sp. 1_MG-2023]|uniref:MBL fold metallo-hydrolase n=1 Tax=Psychrobium sp. 1_MG-2023 TaxID=3062624 RepID=UPI000C331400|nr:MBL fold metallo-hydrolase [Psychrobium sp. 1_MG-2023]MDP2562645.1 MBL fold metallo-hydrolase [Psychrobium sp. 1_MG-2023]PKF53824.1 MBL fold metallo-hydrolase [Alteromonadales bacterium alter-6D02]